MEISISTSLEFSVVECCNCGINFGMPLDFNRRLRNNHNGFYCPNGHVQHYQGETEAQKLQKELKRKEQELADTVSAKLRAQNSLAAAEKKLSRVQNGVCPCCNRSFKCLASHMKNKHPELTKKK